MTKLQLEQYEKIAEAILFAGGEPVDQKVVAQAMEVDEDAAVAVLESLKTIYSIKHKNGEIRRANVNIAATTVENYRKLKEAGIGTYIFISRISSSECISFGEHFQC